MMISQSHRPVLNLNVDTVLYQLLSEYLVFATRKIATYDTPANTAFLQIRCIGVAFPRRGCCGALTPVNPCVEFPPSGRDLTGATCKSTARLLTAVAGNWLVLPGGWGNPEPLKIGL